MNSIQVFEAVVAIFVGTRRWGLLGQAVMEVATAYVYVGTCTYTVYIYNIMHTVYCLVCFVLLVRVGFMCFDHCG